MSRACFVCDITLGTTFIETRGQVFCLRCEGRVSGLIRREVERYRPVVEIVPRLLRVIAALMPGVRHIAVQDYAELNDAPVAAGNALTTALDGTCDPAFEDEVRSALAKVRP